MSCVYLSQGMVLRHPVPNLTLKLSLEKGSQSVKRNGSCGLASCLLFMGYPSATLDLV